MDRGAWWATVHGVTQKSDMTEATYTLKLEKNGSFPLCMLYHRHPLTSYLGISLYKMEAIILEHPPSGCFTLAPLNGLPLRNVLSHSPHSSHHVLLPSTLELVHFSPITCLFLICKVGCNVFS